MSAFVKGEASLAGCEPLRLLREINTGNRVGGLCRSDLVPPLVQDFARQCKKYRLRQDSADRQAVTLEVFTKGLHRAESRFLHQTISWTAATPGGTRVRTCSTGLGGT